MVKKYGELYLNARKALRPSQGDNASVYARELLSLASGKSVAALRPGGTICFEFGFGQETALTELLQAAGYEDVTLRKDLRGVVRAVSAKKPEA